MFESVVFPAPFSPSSAWTSPAAASKSTWSFATTAGNRFVIPRSATAEEEGGEARASPPSALLALGATDDALDEPGHAVHVLAGHALALRDPQLARLVVERACELVERAVDQRRLLGRDRRLRLRTDLRTVRSEADHLVFEVAVVEVGLPGPVHRCLDLAQVVRAPVVDRRRQPLLGRELPRVRVVADPRDALLLCVLPRSRAVDVLAEHVGTARMQVLGRLRLLAGIEPGVRQDQLHLDARVRRLRTERERVGV